MSTNQRALSAALVKHVYVSTACQHVKHRECRETCKFCDAACQCPCHRGEIDPDFPVAWKAGEPIPDKVRDALPPDALRRLEELADS